MVGDFTARQETVQSVSVGRNPTNAADAASAAIRLTERHCIPTYNPVEVDLIPLLAIGSKDRKLFQASPKKDLVA